MNETPKEYHGDRKTPQGYYKNVVLHNRELVKSPTVMRCPCPNDLCDWKGKCAQCIALHRHHNNHVPYCLQSLVNDNLAHTCKGCKSAMAQLVESTVDESGNLQKKAGTPIEFRKYVKEQDALSKLK